MDPIIIEEGVELIWWILGGVGVVASEGLPFVSKLKSNGIIHLVFNLLRALFKPKNKKNLLG